jgi:uncharacterized protein involved in tolerance to divalent cations
MIFIKVQEVNLGNFQNISQLNPFIYNTPVRGEDFCNREETIQTLLNDTVIGKSQGNVWIVGERQTGKTSLLRYMQLSHEDYNERVHIYGTNEKMKVAFIYMNCQTLKKPDDYYYKVYQSLNDFFDLKIKSQDDHYSCFIDALKKVYELKHYIVFLLDEFDAFIQKMIHTHPDQVDVFLSELNNMSQAFSKIKGEPKTFSCVFGANYTLGELLKNINVSGSGLISEMIVLPFFTCDHIHELASRYLQNYSLSFSDAEIQFCYKITNGYPYLVQKLLSIMYDQKMLFPQVNDPYFEKIKNRFQLELESIVENWGNETMPPRTKHKINDILDKFKISTPTDSNSDQFDVFICYNRKDWASVETIAKKLVEKDITPWVDIWNLRPGFIWQKELGHHIKTIKSAAIFIGKDKFGDWQEREVLSFLDECSKREFPVIPVFLEDSEETPDDLPPFLKNHTCVDFRIKNPDPIENLIFGIAGTKQNQGKQ